MKYTCDLQSKSKSAIAKKRLMPKSGNKLWNTEHWNWSPILWTVQSTNYSLLDL